MKTETKEFAWQRREREYQLNHVAKQKKTPINKNRIRKPEQIVPIDPSVTNHQRALSRHAFRMQSQELLRNMVAETKANHPDERMSYTAWKKLAMMETQEKLREKQPA